MKGSSLIHRRTLRERMAAIKPNLPGNWRGLFLEAHPTYNNYKGYQKLDNVAAGKSTDETIIVFLESLVEQPKKNRKQRKTVKHDGNK